MQAERYKKIAIIMIILFVLSVPFMISFSEHRAYKEGFINGMGAEREIIETDIANGATANRTCQEVNNMITCKVTWKYLPFPKNATEQRQRYGLK